MVLFVAIEYSYFMLVALFLIVWRTFNGPLVSDNYFEQFLVPVTFYLGVFLALVGVEYIVCIFYGLASPIYFLVAILSIPLGVYLILCVLASPGTKEILLLITVFALGLTIYLLNFVGINVLKILQDITDSLTITVGIFVILIFALVFVIPRNERILWSSESAYKIVMNKAWIPVAIVATVESLLIAYGMPISELLLKIFS